MSRLTYIHDTLYWDDKPINELNNTERGEMADWVNSLPDNMIDADDTIDRDDVDDIADKLEDLAEKLRSL